MNEKRGNYTLSFNSLEIVPNDPTIRKAKFIVCDFLKSGNNQVIEKSIAEECLNTLIGKRITCKYIPVSENGGEVDALGSHEEYQTTNRNGDDVIYTDTLPIGFIENAYIGTYTKDNEEIECIIGEAILWADDKYLDIILLLDEWLQRGISINMSCEYLYFNYSVKDGLEYIESPILFTAHTILNSEDRGDSIEILPSYECATLLSINEIKSYNKVINSLQSSNNLDSNKLKQINNTQKEEENVMENKFLKALNEISLGDLRSKILGQLGDVMTANEYEYMWLSNYSIFPESKYFIYETYDKESEKWVNYKVTYSVDESDNLTVNYEAKEKVEYQYSLVSVNELKELESSKNAKEDLEKSKNELEIAQTKIEELTEENKSLNEKMVEKSNNAKVDTEKFEELTNKLLSLNAMVTEMQPVVDKYNQEVFEKSLNKAKENYKVKFTSVNALDVFEEDSTQELIKESINSVKEKANEAKYSLNALIVNSIKPIEEKVDEDDILSTTPKISINQVIKSEDTKELTDIEDNVLSEYGFNY